MKLTIEQALQKGVAAHKEGKLQEAERFYRAILSSQPSHPDANHNLGVLTVSMNKAEAALPLFKTALEANPKVEQFWLSYIDALIKEEQFDNAQQVLELARKQGVPEEKLNVLEAKLTPTAQVHEPRSIPQSRNLKFSEKRKKLAERKKQKVAIKKNLQANNPSREQLTSLLEHYQNGRYSDAEKLAVSITQKFPEHQFTWKVLGAVLRATGRKSDAVDANQTAVALSSQDPEAHSNLGVTFKELGRLDEAEASYNQAIALKADYAEAHSNLGATLKELGRLDEAEVSLRQAIALKPDYVEAYSNLGITLQELGRLDEAEVSYNQAIALKADYAEAHSNLGNTLQELGRLDEAEASYNQAIALQPDYAEAYSNLGGTLRDLGRLDEAEASYNQAIALKADYAEAHSNLGVTLEELGRLDEAEASYNEAIGLKPDYAEAHYNLGITLRELGRLDEAEASYNQAIVLKPDSAEAHSNLGVLLKELGRLDEAEASYNQAIALKPDSAKALSNRSYLLFDKGEYEAALRDADACILDKKSRELPFISLYALGRVSEIYKRLEIQSKTDAENISLAAFATFISEVEKKPTAFNFCPNPIDFIHIANLSYHVNDSVAYIKGIIEELNKIKTIWEPSGRTTVSGSQSLNGMNLFKNPAGKIAQLKSIIINEIEAYYLKFQNEQCPYIKKFPTTRNLFGWTVILKQQGHQNAHIHPSGWLSGVIYIKVVPSLGKDEGAIEFSLNSRYYHDVNSTSLTFQPEVGDIVFFPSSLHHKTIPFTTNADRIIVSFDLIPKAARPT